MRNIFKSVFINAVSLFILSWLIPGLTYNQNPAILLVSAVALALANLLVKPLLKLLMTPLSIVTFGLATWFINVIVLYLVIWLVPGLELTPYSLTLLGTTYTFNYFWSLVVLSCLLSISSTCLHWLLK